MGDRKKIKSNHELRSKNSKEVWQRPEYRERISALRKQTIETKRAAFPRKLCVQCGVEYVCFPSRVNKQMTCSRECRIAHLRGKPNHKNRGNRPSARAGSGIKGTYKTWTFRSTYELSFIMNVVEPLNLMVEYEPLKIPAPDGRFYIPDFVSHSDRVVFEIKHERACKLPRNVVKLDRMNQWCIDHGYRFEVYTENRMVILSYDEISQLVIDGIITLQPRKNVGIHYRRVLNRVNSRISLAT